MIWALYDWSLLYGKLSNNITMNKHFRSWIDEHELVYQFTFLFLEASFIFIPFLHCLSNYRSDGKEVMVDNKFLKANNPLLVTLLPIFIALFPFSAKVGDIIFSCMAVNQLLWTTSPLQSYNLTGKYVVMDSMSICSWSHVIFASLLTLCWNFVVASDSAGQPVQTFLGGW